MYPDRIFQETCQLRFSLQYPQHVALTFLKCSASTYTKFVTLKLLKEYTVENFFHFSLHLSIKIKK